jgi:hypothetical protein
VSAGAFLSALGGRAAAGGGARARLRPARAAGGARLLVYLTGHGGGGFLKLSDAEELAAADVAAAVAAGLRSGAWASATAFLDTCQAATLAAAWRSPGALALASSAEGENSLSMGVDAGGAGGSLGDGFSTLLAAFLLRATPLPPCVEPLPMQLPHAGPLSLQSALALARSAAAASAACAEESGGRGAAPPSTTLADVVDAIPSQSIGSTVVVHGGASAPLAFYASELRCRRAEPPPLLGDPVTTDADDIAAALSAHVGGEPPHAAACAALQRSWRTWQLLQQPQAAASLAAFLAYAQRCGAGTRAAVAPPHSGAWWSAALPSAAAASRCRDALAQTAGCAGYALASGPGGGGDIERALLRSRTIDEVFGSI